MATALAALRSVSAYPIPQQVIETSAAVRGLDIETEPQEPQKTFSSKEFKLCKADVYMWLSTAPNVSQGGQSYSFNEEQRTAFRNMAMAIYGEYEDEAAETKPVYGYKGHRL